MSHQENNKVDSWLLKGEFYMKKILIVSLVFLLLSSNAVFATNLNDISEHWAKNNIEILIEKGVIKGYPDRNFKPNSDITVAEVIKLVMVSVKSDVGNALDGFWASKYIEQAIIKNTYCKENLTIITKL